MFIDKPGDKIIHYYKQYMYTQYKVIYTILLSKSYETITVVKGYLHPCIQSTTEYNGPVLASISFSLPLFLFLSLSCFFFYLRSTNAEV